MTGQKALDWRARTGARTPREMIEAVRGSTLELFAWDTDLLERCAERLNAGRYLTVDQVAKLLVLYGRVVDSA